MSAVPSRKFTLRDAMMLVAATAIAIRWSCGMLSGVVIFRLIHRSAMTFPQPGVWEQIVKRFPLSTWLQLWVRGAVPFLASWTVTMVVYSFLHQPRQRLDQLTRQPGFAACCAGTMAMVIDAAWITARGLVCSYPDPWGELWILITVNLVDVGFAIGGARMMLAGLGIWNTERDWVDRLGRFLGISWIAVAMLWRGQDLLQALKW